MITFISHLTYAIYVLGWKKVAMYSKRPIGMRLHGKHVSEPSWRLVPRPLARLYSTFDRSLQDSCTMAEAEYSTKSSGTVFSISWENKFDKTSNSPSSLVEECKDRCVWLDLESVGSLVSVCTAMVHLIGAEREFTLVELVDTSLGDEQKDWSKWDSAALGVGNFLISDPTTL